LVTDDPFPVQLSPPPKSHYRHQSRIKNKQLSDEFSETGATENQPQKDQEVGDNIDDGKLKKREKEPEKTTLQIPFDDFGLATTSLNYVSNWENGTERCKVTRGEWDIEQDIQNQLELAKKISHDM
jgi:hypothetical protein